MENYEESQNRFLLSERSPSEYQRHARSNAEYICAQIADALGESDMRFILARLHQFKGNVHPIEQAYSVVKDEVRRGKCRNPRALFNHLVTKELKNQNGERS
ncbi:MAG: hypothetical protein A2644_03995 [Candidatus Zambryskibacteria bacterium RIFCSPHIGHO2_01_FULL_39_63]|nr:MAG: hypothetical protein A2644_03995 [Candidatus Zambryskibacteria bacterium RIFCSPHIGHO2_01_FULL_39_63]